MNNQISIFLTTINLENQCTESQIDDFIFCDNNIAENILNLQDKYKFMINKLNLDNKIVAFIIKIVKDNQIIYNQLFDFMDKSSEIINNTSHTVFTYDIKDNKIYFTRFWIYLLKKIDYNLL